MQRILERRIKRRERRRKIGDLVRRASGRMAKLVGIFAGTMFNTRWIGILIGVGVAIFFLSLIKRIW